MIREKMLAELPKINEVINNYFEANPEIEKILAKDLMPDFIRAGIFKKDYKKGLPIRNILRTLDETDDLHLIPSTLPERKRVNTRWFFAKHK